MKDYLLFPVSRVEICNNELRTTGKQRYKNIIQSNNIDLWELGDVMKLILLKLKKKRLERGFGLSGEDAHYQS